jgi:hypothetical protein
VQRNVGLHQTQIRRVGSSGGGGGENPLTFTQGLTRTVDTVRNDLITGKAGGQTISGGTAAGENLVLQSTTNATQGAIILNSKVGVNVTPAATFQVNLTDDTTPSTIATWDGRHAVTAVGATSTSPGIAHSYQTSGGLALISAIQPGVAWRTLRIQSFTLEFVASGSSNTFSVSATAASLLNFSQPNQNSAVLATTAAAAGSPTMLTLTAPAHTTLATGAEASDVNVNLARTVQFATGALATQRAFVVRAPTYAFVGASVITTAATLAITDAPVAGTNATITNAFALWVQAGLASLDGGILSPTLTGGTGAAGSLTLQSTTNATRGAIVCNDSLGVGRVPGVLTAPPRFAVAGNVTVASSAAATLDYVVVNTPTVTVSGGTNITTALGFNMVSVEPPAYSTTVTIGSGGIIPAAATLAIKGPPTISGGGSFAGGIGAVGLWVQAPALGGVSAVFDGTVAIGTSASSTAGLRMEGTGGIVMTLAASPLLMSLGGDQTLTKSNTGNLFISCNTTGSFIFQAGAGNTEAFRILGTSNAGQIQIAAANLAANGTVATAMSNLGPAGSHTTIQEWLAIKNSGGTLRWIPMF